MDRRNPDKETRKKRNIERFLPAYLQTEAIKSFFESVVNEVFSPANLETFVSYIGDIPHYHSPETDFYLSEKDIDRRVHQFEPVIAVSSLSNTENISFYEDLVNYLFINGGQIENHERLFSSESYSFAPPIDMDKFVNYKMYYWLPDGYEPYEIADPTDLQSLVGLTSANVVIGSSTVALSNGMILLPLNDVTPSLNGKRLIVEGVGRYIFFIDFDELADTGGIPDYITMERGALDRNPWSYTNKWFHRDVIKNLDDPSLVKIQAARPILEFERNLELFSYGKNSRGYVDLVVDCPDFYSLLNGLEEGFDGGPFAADGSCGIDFGGYDNTWPDKNLGIANVWVTDRYNKTVQIKNGVRILILNSSTPGISDKVYEIASVELGRIDINVVPNGADITGSPNAEDMIHYVNAQGHFLVFTYDGSEWIEGQKKEKVNQPILFQLYDREKNKLQDTSVYPGSSFRGSEIFGYKPSDSSFSVPDPVLGFPIEYDEFGEFIFENKIETEEITYLSVTNERWPILSRFWRRKAYGPFSDEYGNNWNKIPEKIRQQYVEYYEPKTSITEYELDMNPVTPIVDSGRFFSRSLIVKINGQEKEYSTDFTVSGKKVEFVNPVSAFSIIEFRYISDEDPPANRKGAYDIPLNLTNNPENEKVTTISFGDIIEHAVDIIVGQSSGSPYGANTYRDSPKRRWYGKKILQHSATLLKLMVYALQREIDIVTAIKFVKREFVRFRNKFIQQVNQIYVDGSLPSTNPDDWIETILKKLNIVKSEEFPFFNSGVAFDPFNPLSTWIPPSMAFLGVTPVYEPAVVTEEIKIGTPADFIRCHDGALIPTFGDFRDQVILRLEEKIFDSIPNDIKERLPVYSIYDVVPGKFRTTEWPKEKIKEISEKLFYDWMAIAGVSLEDIGPSTDTRGFELNYSSVPDVDGEPIPGYWRGIYLWYYDTDRPHEAPWEMLGFTVKPSWWDAEYGPPPYTRSNNKLWQDLEAGLIRQGPRSGIDTRFARPGLSTKFIPVDNSGNLLSPREIGIVNRYPHPSEAEKPYKFGDGGPVEFIWRTSEGYSFDLALLKFFLKPSQFVDYFYDSPKVTRVFPEQENSQIILKGYESRVGIKNIAIHNKDADSVEPWIRDYFDEHEGLIRVYGLSMVFSDFAKSLGYSDSSIESMNNSVSLKLGNKMGGFITRDLNAVSDTFGSIPRENYRTRLHRNYPDAILEYSGVVVEKVENGYAVYGFSKDRKYFEIEPSNVLGPFAYVSVGETVDVEGWAPFNDYNRGDIVTFNGNYYKALIDHTSGQTFESRYWTPTTVLPRGITVKKYLSGTGNIERVTYGTIIPTIDGVFDFLISYERALKRKGFVFDKRTDSGTDVRDWTWAGKEFIIWTLTDPDLNEFIALSPASTEIKIELDFGFIEEIGMFANKFPVLNSSGSPIDREKYVVVRSGRTTKIEVVDETDPDSGIYYLEALRSSIEHAVIFDSETNFGDTLYNPVFGIKIPRIRLLGIRSKNWEGRYSAQGFLIADDEIIPNYDTLVEQFRTLYSKGNPGIVDETWKDYGFHNLGYQDREYLNRLIISDLSQVDFYQGAIRRKGSKDSIGKLLRSQFIFGGSELDLYEEWAFRVGEFGGVENEDIISVKITDSAIKRKPQDIEIKFIDVTDKVLVEETRASCLSVSQTSYIYCKDDRSLLYRDNNGVRDASWDEVFEEKGYFLEQYPSTYFAAIDSNEKIIGLDSRFVDIPLFRKESEQIFEVDYHKKKILTLGAFRIEEADYFIQSKEEFIGLYDFVRSNGQLLSEGERIVIYNPVGIRELDNFVDWGILDVCTLNTAVSSVQTLVEGTESYLKISFTSNVITNNVVQVGDILTFSVPLDSDFILQGSYEVVQTEGINDIIVENRSGLFVDLSPVEIPSDLEIFTYRKRRFETLDQAEEYLSNDRNTSPTISVNLPTLIYISDGRFGTELQLEKPYQVVHEVTSVDPNAPIGFRITTNFIRKEEKFFDNAIVEEALIYDMADPESSIKLTVFDPIMGRFPPGTIENIDYIAYYDPAKYTHGDPEIDNVQPGNAWGREQLGKIWWNVSTARFLQTNFGDKNYARSYWGKLAPGSQIEIFEWTRSEYPPDEYQRIADQNKNAQFILDETTPTGEVYRPGNTPYVQVVEYDKKYGVDKTFYYFWVKNKLTRSPDETKTKRSIDVAKAIENPLLAGHPWIAVLDERSFLLAIDESLVGETSVLKIKWKRSPEYKRGHTEWLIGIEGDPAWLPDERLFSRFVNSLVGYTEVGKKLPQGNLPENLKYGLLPYQSVFKNRYEARRNVIEYLNKILVSTDFLNNFYYPNFLKEDPKPDSYTIFVATLSDRDTIAGSLNVGDTVLVENEPRFNGFWSLWKLESKIPVTWKLISAQRYKTSDFLEIVDYFEEGAEEPTKTFQTVTDRDNAASQGLIYDGEVVKVEDVGGSFEWQRYDANTNSFVTVAREKSTIKLSSKFYQNTVVYGIDTLWDHLTEDDLEYLIANRDGSLELRELMYEFEFSEALPADVRNRLFFAMVNYVLTENQFIDWLFKTSTISISFAGEILSRDPLIKASLFDSVVEFAEEMKPYHVKFRNLKRTLRSPLDVFEFDVNDFSDPTSPDFDIDRARKINLIMRYDRVTCGATKEPYRFTFIGNDTNSYVLASRFASSVEPYDSEYEAYNSIGKWLKENIRSVYILDINTFESRQVSSSEFDIVVDSSASEVRIEFVSAISSTEKIVVERKLNAAERITLFTSLDPAEEIPGCSFRGRTVEGGAFVLTSAYFEAVQHNLLSYFWDLFPDKDFFETHIKPSVTPSGIPIEDYIDYHTSAGRDWREEYFKEFWNSDPYLINWFNMYGFAVPPWDGGPLSETFASATGPASGASIYDYIHDSSFTVSGDTVLEGYKFVMPYYNRPEELSLVRIPRSLHFTIDDLEYPGIPVAKRIKIFGNQPGSLKLDSVPLKRDAILVFINGNYAIESEDYFVDWNSLEVNILPTSNKLVSNNNSVEIIYYEPGGRVLSEKHYYGSEGKLSGLEFETDVDDDFIDKVESENIYVVEDGNEIAVSAFGGNVVSLVQSAVSTNVVDIYVQISGETTQNLYKYSNTISAGFSTSDLPQMPEVGLYEEHMLVFVSGKLMRPPIIKYFTAISGLVDYNLDYDISGAVFVKSYINNNPVSHTVTSTSSIRLASVPVSGDVVKILIGDEYDYEATASGVATSTPMVSDTRFDFVVWHKNSGLEGRFERFTTPTKIVTLYGRPSSRNALIVAVSGNILVDGRDYEVYAIGEGFDKEPFDYGGYDTDVMVRIEFEKEVSDICVVYFDSKERIKTIPIHVFTNDGRGFLNTFVDRPEYRAHLEYDLSDTGKNATVRHTNDVHPALRKDLTFHSNVEDKARGVVWFNAERVEIEKSVRGSGAYDISIFNRGTLITPKGVPEYRMVTYIYGDNSSNAFEIAGLSGIPVENISVVKYDYGTISNAPSEIMSSLSWPFNFVPISETVFNISLTSITVEGQVYLSGNTVVFSSALNRVSIVTSAGTVDLPSAVVIAKLSDWTITDISHMSGTRVIYEDFNRLPGGFDFTYILQNREGYRLFERDSHLKRFSE